MPLTAEQKEASKIARRERSQAHRVRRKLREADETLANDAVEAEHGPEIERLASVERAVAEEERLALAEIDARIVALKTDRERCELEGRIRRRRARDPWSDAFERRRQALNAVQADLDVRFPDLVGDARWSAAIWARKAKPEAKGDGR